MNSWMIVSLSHRFIFVHVPKSAGTSIASALKRYDDGRDYKLSTKHEPLQEFLLRNANADFSDFYKFGVVRNSYDRLVSLYCYLNQRMSGKFPRMRQISTFDEFISEAGNDAPWLMSLHSMKTQSSYLYSSEGHRLVHDVFLFDKIEDGLQRVSARTGLDIRIRRLNHSEHASYREYYSDRSRKIVARLFAEDIERFGFRF